MTGSIGCRFFRRTTGRRSARSARRSAGPSKGSPFPTIWRRRSPARSPGSASTPPMRSDPARRRRTCRLRNGFDHRKVHMAVVVQQMVFPQAAGILFTADPVTGNRKVASVEASLGLGEALVSGLVNADVYKVRDGEVVARAVATKQLAIHASPAGGTEEQTIEPERQEQPALTDAQVVRLAQLGRRIEAHFGCPQDIEWCLVD